MNKIRRGDVVIMDLPFDSGSHIQGGKRPWVVLQNDTGNASSPCTIVAPLTTKIQRLDIPSHVPLVWKGIRPSMIQCEQVRVVDNREDEWQFLCHLPPEIMEHIDTALMAAFFFTPPHIEVVSVMEIDPREYFGAVEDFLREIQGLKVRSICMVALTDDPDTFDVVSAYDAGPMELAACACILQMHAAYRYGEINRDPPGNSEDAEE